MLQFYIPVLEEEEIRPRSIIGRPCHADQTRVGGGGGGGAWLCWTGGYSVYVVLNTAETSTVSLGSNESYIQLFSFPHLWTTYCSCTCIPGTLPCIPLAMVRRSYHAPCVNQLQHNHTSTQGMFLEEKSLLCFRLVSKICFFIRITNGPSAIFLVSIRGQVVTLKKAQHKICHSLKVATFAP